MNLILKHSESPLLLKKVFVEANSLRPKRTKVKVTPKVGTKHRITNDRKELHVVVIIKISVEDIQTETVAMKGEISGVCSFKFENALEPNLENDPLFVHTYTNPVCQRMIDKVQRIFADFGFLLQLPIVLPCPEKIDIK